LEGFEPMVPPVKPSEQGSSEQKSEDAVSDDKEIE